MMSASLSLSLPRLGWKSTSTPRSLKICTAAGESASEMRTFGLDMIAILQTKWAWQSSPSPFVERANVAESVVGWAKRSVPTIFAPYSVIARSGATKQSRLVSPELECLAIASNDGTTSSRKALGRHGQRRLGLGKGPVDPLRQQRDVLGFDRGAAPDAQAGRRVAIMREVESGVLLLDHRHQLLGKVDLGIGRQRRDGGIDYLQADRGVGANLGIGCEEIDPRSLRLPVGEHLGVGVGARD